MEHRAHGCSCHCNQKTETISSFTPFPAQYYYYPFYRMHLLILSLPENLTQWQPQTSRFASLSLLYKKAAHVAEQMNEEALNDRSNSTSQNC